jgi:hypothetical protein
VVARHPGHQAVHAALGAKPGGWAASARETYRILRRWDHLSAPLLAHEGPSTWTRLAW